jgi:endo-1,4-beta-xylanase
VGKWAGEIGTARYVAAHLKAAREAHPAATLLVNDYRTDNTFLNILEQLEENGRFLFDAVGIQSHMHAGTWPLHSVWSICDRFARLGRPIHFTETTVLSGPAEEPDQWEPTTPEGETAQADYVASLYTTLFSHPAVERITWWDLSDLGAWKGAPAGWLRRDMTPKPVYDRLLSLIKDQWWTRAAGQTDLWGEFRTRAFFGAHRVTVTLPNGVSAAREVNWKRGATNRFVVRLTN